eukprot:TRINITY_DN22101_c0_g2_i1.p1 TRINITY_DN22101_c0_g2~~TRINITY_DN22101_c0_g2_i1.p1  ORF type:complete len:1541 (-),score=142.98 TRINITY_DN22101_c0_g2_i1:93-4715(-)
MGLFVPFRVYLLVVFLFSKLFISQGVRPNQDALDIGPDSEGIAGDGLTNSSTSEPNSTSKKGKGPIIKWLFNCTRDEGRWDEYTANLKPGDHVEIFMEHDQMDLKPWVVGKFLKRQKNGLLQIFFEEERSMHNVPAKYVRPRHHGKKSRMALSIVLRMISPKSCKGSKMCGKFDKLCVEDKCHPEHVCKIPGVRCDEHGNPQALEVSGSLARKPENLTHYIGRVKTLQSIHLLSNAVSGRIPKEISDIPFLSELIIKDNPKLSGEIPRSLGFCPSLKHLKLRGNHLEGHIPPELGMLKQLDRLDVSENRLTGLVPNLWHLEEMTEFHAAGNDLKGPLPDGHKVKIEVEEGDWRSARLATMGFDGFTVTFEDDGCMALVDPSRGFKDAEDEEEKFSAFSYLLDIFGKDVRLNDNNITGPFPEYWSHFHIEQLYMSNNQLSGELPKKFSPSLNYLILRNNNFSGRIPPTVANMSRLYELDLGNNSLEGSIPEEIFSMDNLEALALHNNRLSGPLPRDLPYATFLCYLELSQNQLSGEVPDWNFTKAHSLNALYLSSNNLTGPLPKLRGFDYLIEFWIDRNYMTGGIPDEWTKLGSIGSFDLSHNSLSGKLPHFFGTAVPNLDNLNLACNNFEGQIPEEWSNLKSISYLFLENNSLHGPLPKFIGKLPLMSVNLGVNGFTGPIPAEWASMNSTLSFLNLMWNKLTGELPNFISSFKGMKWMELCNNSFHGTIPQSWAALVDLEWIDLSHNNLHGELPAFLGSFKNIHSVQLAYNNFEGKIPQEWDQMKTLDWLYLNSNRLTGTLPYFLSENPNLEYLDVGNNLMEGPLPLSWAKLKKLRTLDVANNSFQGGIPNHVCHFPLHWLDLSRNGFTGGIPTCFRNMSDLVFFDMSHNRLSGTIPEDIGHMGPSVYALFLKNNSLSGPIPKSLAYIKTLSFLDLSGNELTGKIPIEFGNLTDMKGLFLYANFLTGAIPRTMENLSKLSYFAVHDNDLAGDVPYLRLSVDREMEEKTGSRHPMVLSMYANHLSCAVPNPLPNNVHIGPDDIRGHLGLGNKFSAAPEWWPKDAEDKSQIDKIHYVQPWVSQRALFSLLGLLIWVVAMVLVVRTRGGVFEFCRRFYDIKEHPDYPEIAAHRNLIWFLVKMCVFSAFLLPTYAWGARYVKCGDQFAHTSITYLSDCLTSERFAVFMIILHFLVAARFIQSFHERHDTKVADVMNLSKLLKWLGWFVICCAAALPGMAYAFMRSIPSDNIIRTDYLGGNSAVWMAIFGSLPVISGLVCGLLLPLLGAIYAKATKIRIDKLLFLCQIITSWVAPAIVVVFIDGHCFKNWLTYWNVCQPGSPGYSDYDISLPVGGKLISVMATSEICHVPKISEFSNHAGGCSREVLETLAMLLFWKVGMDIGVFPILNLALWYYSELAEDGTLQMQRLKMRTSFTTTDYFVQLDIWAACSVLWGPLFPLIQPALLATVTVSAVMLLLEKEHFGRSDNSIETDDKSVKSNLDCTAMSKVCMRLSVAALIVILALFSIETGVFRTIFQMRWGDGFV